jgi:hypothetical protein
LEAGRPESSKVKAQSNKSSKLKGKNPEREKLGSWEGEKVVSALRFQL